MGYNWQLIDNYTLYTKSGSEARGIRSWSWSNGVQDPCHTGSTCAILTSISFYFTSCTGKFGKWQYHAISSMSQYVLIQSAAQMLGVENHSERKDKNLATSRSWTKHANTVSIKVCQILAIQVVWKGVLRHLNKASRCLFGWGSGPQAIIDGSTYRNRDADPHNFLTENANSSPSEPLNGTIYVYIYVYIYIEN